MSILSIAAAALLLAAGPAEPPPPSPAPAAEPVTVDQPVAPVPEQKAPDLAAPPPAVTPPAMAVMNWPPAATATVAAPSVPADPKARQVRAGLGVSVTDADSGFASTFQAGVQVDPWDHLGFRAGMGMTSSVVGAGGWDAAELTGAVLYRPLGNDRRVVPYAGLGVQFALLAIFPDYTPPPQGMARMGTGHLAPNFTAAPGENVDRPGGGFGGTSQFKVMPEATVGALVRLSPRLDLDVAGRYLPLFWNGTTYNGLSIVASVCAPF